MDAIDLFKKLEGVQTVESVMALLGVGRQKAIYSLHRLRKQGYVKTRRRSDQTRIYKI
jgi:DNA-binding PadR family transcriptional regulator